MNKQVSYKIVSLTFGILVLCFAVGFYVVAWTPPTAPPPGNNVDSPLNVGPNAQYKSGGLILNTGGADNGLIVDKGNVGIGTTEPQAKLDVNGNVKANDYYIAKTGKWASNLGGGGTLSCITKICDYPAGKPIYSVVSLPCMCDTGYTATGGGVIPLSRFDIYYPRGYVAPSEEGNGYDCHFLNDKGFTCYVRCCKIQ